MTVSLLATIRRAALASLVGLAGALSFGPAQAQDVGEMWDRLSRLERDLRDLQYEVYKGNPPAQGGGAPASLGMPAPGSNTRINDMEQTIRELRGQVEQLTFQVRQMQETLDLVRKETNYRLSALEGGAPSSLPPISSAPSAPSALPAATAPRPAGSPTGLTPPLGAQPAGGSAQMGSPPGTMGTLPVDAATAATTPPATLTPREQYDAAMDLLTRAQYDQAQGAFATFVAANPTSEYAGPAQFWVGDIAFTKKDYANAAKAFADVLKRFGKMAKAPDAMLKLGLSLMELNQKKDGCTTLGALKAKYPNANPAILDRAAKRFKEAKCA